MAVTAETTERESPWWQEFRRGVLTVAPIWAGVVPVGIAIAVSALAAGFTPIETIALSGLVFAGAAQIVAVSLFSGGASLIAIVLTVLFVNLRHVLYGMSLHRQLPERTRPSRPVLAFFLVDESYGIATRDHLDGRGGAAFYMGAGFSFYIVFLLSTVAGVAVGSAVPDTERIGLDFVFPLMFVALIVPLLRSKRHVLVAGSAGVIALCLGQVAGGGVTVLLTTLVAAAFGAWLERS